MQVYLIEVNTCPALGCHGAVLQDLLPRVIEEVVQKAIDPLFPPRPMPRAHTSQGTASQGSVAPSPVQLEERGKRLTTECHKEACTAAKSDSVQLPAPLSGFELLPLSVPLRRSLIERSMSSMAERASRLQAMQGNVSSWSNAYVCLHAHVSKICLPAVHRC